MKPMFEIIADGQDVTDIFADRLVSLRVIDEDGFSADRAEIVIDDRDGRVDLPAMGYTLEISLGFIGEPLAYLGRFVVSGVKGTYPKRTMTISAMAADMAGKIREPKSREWKDVTITDIVGTIAGEHGLKPRVGKSVANELFPYLAQSAESDLHFLTRVSKLLDATAKPSAGYLIVHRRGENETAAGDAIVPVEIDAGRIGDCNWKLAEREDYKTVEAEWSDIDGGATQKAVAGTGDPKRRLRHVFSTQGEAQRAAAAELAMAGRSRLSIDITMAGFQGDAFAGGQLTLKPEFKPELAGNWHVSRVEHSLKTALTTKLTAIKALP